MPRCSGCEGIIFDRFILKLGQDNERHTCWHSGRCTGEWTVCTERTNRFTSPAPGCLVCSDCNTSLTVKCYMKNGQPYCKDDFYKRFAKTRCANCELGMCGRGWSVPGLMLQVTGIAPTAIVRRAQDNVYHLHCFNCILCKRALNTGLFVTALFA